MITYLTTMANIDVLIKSYCIVLRRFINQVSKLLEKALNCRNVGKTVIQIQNKFDKMNIDF